MSAATLSEVSLTVLCSYALLAMASRRRAFSLVSSFSKVPDVKGVSPLESPSRRGFTPLDPPKGEKGVYIGFGRLPLRSPKGE